MTPQDHILFCMKKTLLEYGLRHNLDFVVKSVAMSQHKKFSDYKIPPIRFELFNMYYMVKNKNFKYFETIILFLNEMNKLFTNLIPDALYSRVIGPLKALVRFLKILLNFCPKLSFNFKHIYECLRNGDLKKACFFIKEYFPLDNKPILESPTQKSSNGQKDFEFKILKKRSHWNELILDRNQRDIYFKNEFNIQYNNNFFAFLILKINEIITIFNSHLPNTIIDQVRISFLINSQNLHSILFSILVKFN